MSFSSRMEVQRRDGFGVLTKGVLALSCSVPSTRGLRCVDTRLRIEGLQDGCVDDEISFTCSQNASLQHGVAWQEDEDRSDTPLGPNTRSRDEGGGRSKRRVRLHSTSKGCNEMRCFEHRHVRTQRHTHLQRKLRSSPAETLFSGPFVLLALLKGAR